MRSFGVALHPYNLLRHMYVRSGVKPQIGDYEGLDQTSDIVYLVFERRS